MDKKKSGKQIMAVIFIEGITPLCIYYLVNQCIVILGISLLQGYSGSRQADSLTEIYLRTAVQMAGMFLAAVAVLPFYKRENIFWKEKKEAGNKKILSVKNGAIILGTGAVVSLGLNYLFSALGLLQSSETYNQVAQRQFSLPFWLAFVFYGMLSPWAEELVFRGIFYRVLKRNVTELAAVSGSAVMFGAFHGNVVQMLYGSIMGVAMTLLYRRYQNLLAPVLFHGAANVVIYAASYFF